MLHVGLTGGIGSGKSAIGQALKTRGAHLIEADKLARELLGPDSEILQEVIQAFGPAILDREGHLNRTALAERVFADPSSRRTLEEILHPRINALEQARANAYGAQFPKAVVVYEAPLLVESGAHRAMDRVVVVDVTRARQWQRALARGDRSPEQLQAILAAQCSREERLRHAHDIIDNNDGWSETERQLEALMARYHGLAALTAGEGS